MGIQYFATLAEDSLGSALVNKIDAFDAYIQTSNIFDRMRKVYRFYYGLTKHGFSSKELGEAGENGEIIVTKVNQLANIIDHKLSLITANRPALIPVATNTDQKSMQQTILAMGILDYYTREQRLDRMWRNACEHALLFGTGWIRVDWDFSAGDMFATDENDNPIMSGDLRFDVISPFNIIYDVSKRNADFDWVIIRTYQNKFNVAAQYASADPEFYDRITAMSDDRAREETRWSSTSLVDSSRQIVVECDDIPVYEFYHRPCRSIPEGKVVKFLGDGSILLPPTPLPIKRVPVIRIVNKEVINTAHGWAAAFDLLSLQEVIDRLYSTVISNQLNHGGQSILVPMDANIDISGLGKSGSIIEYKPGPSNAKPEALDLTAPQGDLMNTISKFESNMETISGINSVVRGNPEANLKSGNSLVFMQTQAIQFSNTLMESYNALLEDTGTVMIQFLKTLAQGSRKIQVIAGKTQRWLTKSFNADDLAEVDRVMVDVGNPMTKTHAGRIQLAEDLLNKGMIKTYEQYMMVLTTGRLEPLTEAVMTELMNVKRENEMLGDGQNPVAIWTDNHRLHIREHAAVLSNPDNRANPDVVRVVMEHIQEHTDLLRNTDPDLLALTDQQPLSMPQGQPQPGPGPQDSQGGAAAANAPSPNEKELPGLPTLPNNPMTGEQYQPPAGVPAPTR